MGLRSFEYATPGWHLACILANPTASAPDRCPARRVIVPQNNFEATLSIKLKAAVVPTLPRASEGKPGYGIKARVLG